MKRHLPFPEWDVGTNLSVGISIFIISRMQLKFWTNWYKSYYFVDKYDWNWSNSTCLSSSVIKCISQFSWHGNMPYKANIVNIQARCAQTADVQKFPNYFRINTFCLLRFSFQLVLVRQFIWATFWKSWTHWVTFQSQERRALNFTVLREVHTGRLLNPYIRGNEWGTLNSTENTSRAHFRNIDNQMIESKKEEVGKGRRNVGNKIYSRYRKPTRGKCC